MILKKGGKITDWITPEHVAILKLETPAEHLARVDARARELRDAMGRKHLLHPANQVRRLDGKVYGKPAPQNVRQMRKKIKEGQAA